VENVSEHLEEDCARARETAAIEYTRGMKERPQGRGRGLPAIINLSRGEACVESKERGDRIKLYFHFLKSSEREGRGGERGRGSGEDGKSSLSTDLLN